VASQPFCKKNKIKRGAGIEKPLSERQREEGGNECEGKSSLNVLE
jgi:hypothetical protein